MSHPSYLCWVYPLSVSIYTKHCCVLSFILHALILYSPDSSKRALPGTFVVPTSIKCLAVDGRNIFVGTSSGRIVTIPVNMLSQKQILPSPTNTPSPPQQGSPKIRSKMGRETKTGSVSGETPPRKPPRKGKRSKGTQTIDRAKKSSTLTKVRSSESSNFGGSEGNDSSEHDEVDGVFLDQSAVSLHCHRDKVRMLLHITLPRSRRDLCSPPNQPGNGDCFNSMPNLSSTGYRLSLGQPLFKSLVVSIGKGHLEYSTLPPESEQNLEDVSARRERNKAFQLMLWGHRNSIP